VEPALGGEGEFAGVVRVETGDEEVGARDEGVFGLVEVRRRGLVPRRLRSARGARTAAELELVVLPVVEDAGVLRAELEVQLGVEGLELGLVELAALDDV